AKAKAEAETDKTSPQSHFEDDQYEDARFFGDDEEFIDDEIDQAVVAKEIEEIGSIVAKNDELLPSYKTRRTIPIGRWLHYLITIPARLLVPVSISCFALLLIALILTSLPIFMSPFIEPMQKVLSADLGEPVTIKKMRASLLPQPVLILDDISVGKLSDLHLKSIQITPEILTVFDDVIQAEQIELVGLSANDHHLNRVSAWLRAHLTENKIKTDQIILSNTSVLLDDKQVVPIFNASLVLNDHGDVKSAMLVSEDKESTVNILKADNSYQISVSAKKLTLPFGAPLIMTRLEATGIANDNEINFDKIESYAYSGTLQGKLKVNWSNNWTAVGNLTLTQIDLQPFLPTLTSIASANGYLSSTMTFSSQSSAITTLLDKPEINAQFDVGRGEIKWIDAVRAIQQGKKNMAVGGITAFDNLKGQFILKDAVYQYKQLVLNAGNLQAAGDITVLANQDVEGTIRVKLSTKSRQIRSNLNVSGKASSPISK
ncbi:MAG TPA: hypothetical protein DCG63_11325, partial [Methylophilaceae bacterium]|nr:hypothetical protein [Methylophilaceae bacterium]